jgi:hypothetical protein
MKFFFLLVLVLLSSCAVVYHPNSCNLPMLSGKGEFQGAASVTMSGQWNIQLANAVTDHVGVMANGMMYREKADNDIDQGSLFEVGAGYYKNKKRFYYDVFAGYGIGRIDSKYETDLLTAAQTHTLGPFYRYFVQPGIAFKEKNFQMGCAIRISCLDFSALSESDSGQPAVSPYGYRFFAEPAVVAKYYYKKCYFMIQPSLSMSLDDEQPVINVVPSQVHFGIGVRF